MGAEAIAQGAIDAGISGVYAYPGTPSTEITEYIQKSVEARKAGIRSSWSANEKTAYEAALGMSYAGKRSMVCMKHVGLNVAADAFMNSAITGVKGGLAVVVADDPSMHSSQNEQDTRVYGKFGMVPVLEPASQQELYDSLPFAFNLSEELELPVIIRVTTRLSHSRAGIERGSGRAQNALSPETNRMRFVLIPGNARKRYDTLVKKQEALEIASEESPLNKLDFCGSKTGVIAFGISWNYVMEVAHTNNMDISVLKIGQYPLPKKQIKEFFNNHESILIAEEGYPVYEELLRGFFDNSKIKGRLDGTLPRTGELSPDALAKAMGVELEDSFTIPPIVAIRPPELCKGCSHRDLFEELNEVMDSYQEKHVFSDIGCYALGALPPFNSINTCVDMGASVTMAKGAADAGLRPAVAVIGDSTFTHSGLTGLLDIVNDNAPVTIIISDNYTTAMTGGQDSSATDKLFELCKGSGMEENHIRTIIPLKRHKEENIAVLKEEIEYEGVSVIIAQRECVQTAARSMRQLRKEKEEHNN